MARKSITITTETYELLCNAKDNNESFSELFRRTFGESQTEDKKALRVRDILGAYPKTTKDVRALQQALKAWKKDGTAFRANYERLRKP